MREVHRYFYKTRRWLHFLSITFRPRCMKSTSSTRHIRDCIFCQLRLGLDAWSPVIFLQDTYVIAFSTCTAAMQTFCGGGSRPSIITCLYSARFSSSFLWTMSLRCFSFTYNQHTQQITNEREREREMFYLTTHSTHFIYGYMASDIWLRTILIVRKETRCCHIGYSYRSTARVLLYAPSHRQDNTSYTSCGALAGTRNSSMGMNV